MFSFLRDNLRIKSNKFEFKLINKLTKVKFISLSLFTPKYEANIAAFNFRILKGLQTVVVQLQIVIVPTCFLLLLLMKCNFEIFSLPSLICSEGAIGGMGSKSSLHLVLVLSTQQWKWHKNSVLYESHMCQLFWHIE